MSEEESANFIETLKNNPQNLIGVNRRAHLQALQVNSNDTVRAIRKNNEDDHNQVIEFRHVASTFLGTTTKKCPINFRFLFQPIDETIIVKGIQQKISSEEIQSNLVEKQSCQLDQLASALYDSEQHNISL